MPGFNIVPEIGGVDTSDPFRKYGADEQKAVIDGIFGEDSPEGQLLTPGGEVLYVGRRDEEGSSYSIGRRETGHRNPALFVPRQGRGKEKALLEISGDLESCEGVGFSGFLPLVTRRIVGLGKHAMLEAIRGEEVAFKVSPTQGHKNNRDRLGDLILRGAILDGDRDISEYELDDLYGVMEDLLGVTLWQVELLEEDDHIYNWKERPFEDFCADLQRRLSGIIEH